MDQIQKHTFEALHVVLGVVNDKDLILFYLYFQKKKRKILFCKPNVPRGLDADKLGEKANDFGLIGKVYDSVSEAYMNAKLLAQNTDFIYIGGSTFVVAEIV